MDARCLAAEHDVTGNGDHGGGAGGHHELRDKGLPEPDERPDRARREVELGAQRHSEANPGGRRTRFASFQWAADLHFYGSALRGTNRLVALLAKPIPRHLWPGKPKGLSHEFTAAVAREPEMLILDALAVPPTYTGIGETVRRIGADLARLDLTLPVSLVVRCAADARSLLEPSFPPGTAFETPLASSRPAWRRLTYQLVAAPLRDSHASVVLSTTEIGAWWGRSRRGLIVHDLRRRTAPETAGRGDRLLYNAVVPKAIRHADAILTVSRATELSLRGELAPAAWITVVAPHSGMPVRPLSPVVARGQLVVLSAVRAYKGADLVIEALSRLAPERRPEVAWVGAMELDDPAAEALCGRARAVGLELLGWLPDEELGVLLDAAAAILAPSSFEGYGLSLLEALQRGKPLLASAIPSHREIAGDAARFFDPLDAAPLADLLGRFADGTLDLGDLSRRSHDRAVELAAAEPSWGQALAGIVAALRPPSSRKP